jgi:tRNA (guanine-N7-)-methyltransferase
VNGDTLTQFQRVLGSGGTFCFASDIPDYVDWTLEHVSTHGGFRLTSRSPEPFENWIRTRYEAKAVREGRTPAYLTFQAV